MGEIRMDDSTKTENYFMTPEEIKALYWKSIYDHEKKTFFGRTGRRWCICFSYFAVFYGVLFGFWAVMLSVALHMYSGHAGPWLVLEESRIGGSPALLHLPNEKRIEIRDGREQYVRILSSFLSSYKNLNQDDYKDCQTGHFQPEECNIDLSALGKCSEKPFGYEENMPCIIMRLNKVYSWIPDLFNTTNDLPQDMPSSLKNYISKQDQKMMNMIWLSCEPNAKDASYIKEINYWPYQGFPAYFYPFQGKKQHLSPLIAVQFVSSQGGVTVQIKCQAWAKNIDTDDVKEHNAKFRIAFN